MEIKGITKECESKIVEGIKRISAMPEKRCEECDNVLMGGVTGDGIAFYSECYCPQSKWKKKK